MESEPKSRLHGLDVLSPKDREELFATMRQIAEQADEAAADGKRIADNTPRPWWTKDG